MRLIAKRRNQGPSALRDFSLYRFATFLLVAVSLAASLRPAFSAEKRESNRVPNIVLILADDLGYGDVACYNPKSKIPTPHLDALAREGMRVTDAHSPSTVCTPSRYSLLTGRMCFRTGLRGVLTGVDGPLIEGDRLTLPKLLRQQGYATACVGKWHVGMTFLDHDGQPVARRGGGLAKVRQVDFSRPIQDGPRDVGFDYFFGTVCCPLTDFLYAYIENDRVVEPPTELAEPKPGNWLDYEYFRTGLKSPGFRFREVDLKFLEKSVHFLERHRREHPEQPFFLYHATQSAHLPSLPAKQFVGKSQAGPLGDFVFEFDYLVGELLATLERLGVADNTLVIVSSDNGPEIVAARLHEEYDHDSAGPWRGFKRDNWEGGHRVPFLARWPGHIPACATCDETICLTDLLATCAAITKADLPAGAAEDSVSILPALLGEKRDAPLRNGTLHQTISNALGVRRGKWKLLDHRGSGGNDYRQPILRDYQLPEREPEAAGQLYDLERDPGERENLYLREPDVVAELKRRLKELRDGAGE